MKTTLFEHHDIGYPVTGYGGASRVNEGLFNVLSKLGHEVTLIIADKTTLTATNNAQIIKLPYSEIEDLRWGRTPIATYVEDGIFHSHTSGKHQNFDFRGIRCKWTATCHGENEETSCPNQIFVSHGQLRYHILMFGVNKRIKNLGVCWNGVDVHRLKWEEGPHDRLTWFAHLCPAKSPATACALAERIDEKIVLAGNISDQNYFDAKIKPYITKGVVEYVGPIQTEEDKRELFRNAKYYLHTALSQEAFGLTTVEAQACGIPAFGIDVGGVMETLYDSRFIAPLGNPMYLSEIWQAIENLNHDKDAIQKWVREYMSHESMTEGYLRYWRGLQS